MMLKSLCLAVSLLLLAGVGIYLLQRSLIYFPTTTRPDPQLFLTENMRPIQLLTADGLTLSSWYKAPEENQPVVLYVHGNAGTVGNRMYLTQKFVKAGLGVLLLEYRGYGGNEGSPSEAGLYEDGRAAMQFLSQQGIAEHRTVLYGESLGTGVATQLATEYFICALVLQSPYTSLADLARQHYPWLPIPLRDRYDSLSRMRRIHVPVFMLHGTLDEVVPYSLGQRLFKQANEPKQWKEFPTKGHHDLWDQHFAQLVIEFIQHQCPVP